MSKTNSTNVGTASVLILGDFIRNISKRHFSRLRDLRPFDFVAREIPLRLKSGSGRDDIEGRVY